MVVRISTLLSNDSYALYFICSLIIVTIVINAMGPRPLMIGTLSLSLPCHRSIGKKCTTFVISAWYHLIPIYSWKSFSSANHQSFRHIADLHHHHHMMPSVLAYSWRFPLSIVVHYLVPSFCLPYIPYPHPSIVNVILHFIIVSVIISTYLGRHCSIVLAYACLHHGLVKV